jgi:hypothetical protein
MSKQSRKAWLDKNWGWVALAGVLIIVVLAFYNNALK